MHLEPQLPLQKRGKSKIEKYLEKAKKLKIKILKIYHAHINIFSANYCL
jgi:hypothetical protein